MLADLGQIANRFDQPRRHVTWMGAGKSNAPYPRDLTHPLEQAGELAGRIVRRLIVIHDLPEELYFHATAVGDLADLREDVRHRPHAFVAARVRHDTESTEVVAAFNDRHERTHRISASHDTERKRHVVLSADVHAR